MIIKAKNTNVPVTPRKLQLLAEAIKDQKPADALRQLEYLNYSAALPLRKTLRQAVANAVNNFKLTEDELKISAIYVGKGLTYKKGRPGPKGRFKPYKKVRSHITVELSVPEKAAPSPKALPVSKATPKVEQPKKATPKKAASPKATKTTKKITKKAK